MSGFGFDKTERPKRMLSLSGEFLVVGELLRRGISASISFGEDRSSHVILRNGDKLSFVEVITPASESPKRTSNRPTLPLNGRARNYWLTLPVRFQW